MKFPKTIKASELAELVNGELIGADRDVTGINEIHRVEEGDLVFVDHEKYYDKVLNSPASCILINTKDAEYPDGKVMIYSEDPFRDFNRVLRVYRPFSMHQDQIHGSAKIGEDCMIHPSAYIAPGAELGKNCIIHPNVVIYDHVKLGDNVVIQANTVIGSHAFYYKKREAHHEALHSGGGVWIGDNVEIGARCTIDKGVSADTTIGAGTVIDNAVHVGHDTMIGEMCLIAAQVGIAGCVNIGNRVTIWGQVGFAADAVVEDDVVILAQSGIMGTLEEGKKYFGSPAGIARDKMREIAAIQKLPSIIDNFKK